jgi:hypothetical protein
MILEPLFVFEAAIGAANDVFGVANRLMGCTLGLIDLAFGLKAFVASKLAGGVFDGPFGLIGRTFNVFLVHGRLLRLKTPKKRSESRAVPGV